MLESFGDPLAAVEDRVGGVGGGGGGHQGALQLVAEVADGHLHLQGLGRLRQQRHVGEVGQESETAGGAVVLGKY